MAERYEQNGGTREVGDSPAEQLTPIKVIAMPATVTIEIPQEQVAALRLIAQCITFDDCLRRKTVTMRIQKPMILSKRMRSSTR